MTQTQINRFFRLLSQTFQEPCEILLTGAGAGNFYGHIRATQDVDFEIRFKNRSPRRKDALWETFSAAVDQVSRRTGIAVQYSEDIDHWSSITLHDYRKHAQKFKKFRKLELKLLSVPHWSIGKFSRYIDPDIRDLMTVLKKTKIKPESLLAVLGTALRKSPKSTACFNFRMQVEHFLKIYGSKVWGKDFEVAKAIHRFYHYAHIKIN